MRKHPFSSEEKKASCLAAFRVTSEEDKDLVKDKCGKLTSVEFCLWQFIDASIIIILISPIISMFVFSLPYCTSVI